MPKRRAGTSDAVVTVSPKPKKVNVQSVANDLFFAHGKNLREWPDYSERLLTVGLTPEQITDLVWDRAEIATLKRIEESKSFDKILWNLDPRSEKWGTGQVLVWESLCGRYRLTKFVRDNGAEYGAEYLDRSRWCSVEEETKKGQGYAPSYYESLWFAVDATERYHCDRYKLARVGGNGASLIESEDDCPEEISEVIPETEDHTPMEVAAPEPFVEVNTFENSVVDPLPFTAPVDNVGGCEGESSPSTEEEVMSEREEGTIVEEAPVLNVPEQAVRAMLTAMGVDCEKWNVKTLVKKVSRKEFTATISKGSVELADGSPEVRLFRTLSEAVEAGSTIGIESDPVPETAEENGHTAEKKPSRKAKGKPKKEPKAKSEKAPRAKKEKPPTEKKERKKGPSMVGMVIVLLKSASKDKPITKDKIHATLMRKYPTHNEKSVKDSVNWYVSTMQKKQGIEVQKDGEGGFWIE